MNARTFIHLLGTVAAAASLASCTSQDDIYKQWVKKGGYDYPAKALNLSYVKGYQNLIINWEKPMDPSVRTSKLYWDNYTDSVSIDYADYPDGRISIPVGVDAPLEDRSYTFNVVNFDKEGNRSLASELIASPYGTGWLVSRSERSIVSAKMDGNDAVVVLTKSTDEMVKTRFRYKDLNDQWVDLEKELAPGENEVILPRALKGKRFQYASAFQPADGKDVVWRSWTSSASGISYQLNAKRWAVRATANQFSGENTAEKIFDGLATMAGSWYSSRADQYKNDFPKILAIDTGVGAGNEFAFTEFEFFQHSDQQTMRFVRDVTVYVGNEPYDPNNSDYISTFGIPFVSGTLKNTLAAQSLDRKSVV